MKISLAGVVAALSLLSATEATRIEISTSTNAIGIQYGTTVVVGNDGKRNNFGHFTDGCKTKGFSWLRQICIDSSRNRAHITYSGGTRKCFKRTSRKSYKCGGKEGCFRSNCPRCVDTIYSETRCTW